MDFIQLKEEQRKSLDEDGFLAVRNALDSPQVDRLLHSADRLVRPFLDKPVVPTFRRGWHRDIRIPADLRHEGLSRVGLKMCYCLTGFHQPNSGMTLFCRGTHLRTRPLEVPKGQVDPRDVQVVDLKLNAGDALFFENRIFHNAVPNLSDRVSKVLMHGYGYRWMKQKMYLDNPAPHLLANTDPITRQLLGG